MSVTAEEFAALARVVAESQTAHDKAEKEVPQPTLTAEEIAEVLVTTESKRSKKEKKIIPFVNIKDVINKLDTTANGTIQSNLKNAIRLLRYHPAWNCPEVLYFDSFALEIRTKNSPPWGANPGIWTDVDDIRTSDWMQSLGVNVNKSIARDAVTLIAQDSAVHPVQSYLKGLAWDHKPRIDTWLTDFLGVEDSTLTRALGKAWLTGAVTRIFRPGAQMDYCLSLQGRQGIGKSTALRILASDAWFSDHVSSLQDKDSRLELLGKWIIELSELGPVRRSDNERVKQFLSARYDYVRPPYALRCVSIPRQVTFAASFNDWQPFSDVTGARRFWPVSCQRIKLRALEASRPQLWAEAYLAYKAGAPCYLNSDELNKAVTQEQADRMQSDPWDAQVLRWCDKPHKTGSSETLLSEPGRVSVPEILLHCIGKPLKDWDRKEEIRIAHILTRAGWIRKRIRLDGPKNNGRYFYVRED